MLCFEEIMVNVEDVACRVVDCGSIRVELKARLVVESRSVLPDDLRVAKRLF
jgi:hypothetical protein